MRPVGDIVDILAWRAGVAIAGLRLRLSSLFSVLVVFGGIGTAIGFGVVNRLAQALEDDDEADTRPISE